MSVTVIIPTYNRSEYLPESLSSVLGQTLSPAQLIVVDDGSIDNTRDVVARFGARIQYIAKPNGGKSSALNFALPHATGEFIWIFDDDDIAEPDALERLLRALQENPGCGFAYGEYDLFTRDESGRTRRTPVNFTPVNPKDLYLALMERSFILQQGLLVRKSCYDEVGPFDESLIRSQDLEMMLRLARRYQGIKVAGTMFHQRQHAGTRGSKASPVSAKNMVSGWVKSDREIIGRICATHDLATFFSPAADNHELTQEQKLTALLQRACITARKGMWSEAAEDLRRARDIAEATGKRRLNRNEIAILRRVFDLFSYAPHTFEDAGEFQSALKEMKPLSLQRDMRAAIIWSLPFTIGAARLHGQKANFFRFLRIYFQLVTPGALLRTLFDASFLSAGLELLQNRRNQQIAFERSQALVKEPIT
jgi:glycosyltransferase involved in cell wall biosynthesis